MKAVVCNKCKAVITDESKLKDTIGLKLWTPFLGVYDEMHLCEDCKSDFWDWISNKEEKTEE
jgi:uncharacterized protein with PIN domain